MEKIEIDKDTYAQVTYLGAHYEDGDGKVKAQVSFEIWKVGATTPERAGIRFIEF